MIEGGGSKTHEKSKVAPLRLGPCSCWQVFLLQHPAASHELLQRVWQRNAAIA